MGVRQILEERRRGTEGDRGQIFAEGGSRKRYHIDEELV